MTNLVNGQCWRQKEFPNYHIVVLALPDGEFCRAGLGDCGTSPVVMTDNDGRWRFTEAELLSLLQELDYTPIQSRRVSWTARGPGGNARISL